MVIVSRCSGTIDIDSCGKVMVLLEGIVHIVVLSDEHEPDAESSLDILPRTMKVKLLSLLIINCDA